MSLVTLVIRMFAMHIVLLLYIFTSDLAIVSIWFHASPENKQYSCMKLYNHGPITHITLTLHI